MVYQVLDIIPTHLGLEEIRERLVAFESHRGAYHAQQRAQAQAQGHNKGGYYKQPRGILAMGQAQDNLPEENEALDRRECTESQDKPLTAAQMRQVTQEQSLPQNLRKQPSKAKSR